MIAIKAATALALLLAPPHAHPGVVGPGVQKAVARHGTAFVQVAFATRQPRTLAGVRSTVRVVRARVLAQAGNGFRATTHWDAVLGMAGAVLDLLPTSTYRQMAAALYISPHTVKSHLRAVYRKLGAETRSQALQRAGRARLRLKKSSGRSPFKSIAPSSAM